MNPNLIIGITLCALAAGLILVQFQIRYIHRRMNTLFHRRAIEKRGMITLVRDGTGALAESMRRHPAGRKLKAVK